MVAKGIVGVVEKKKGFVESGRWFEGQKFSS